MAENMPPGTNNANGASDAARGMPYYEKLRKDLREILSKKRQLDQTLATAEENILKAETAYLEETTAGNIIKGFDNYIKGSTLGTSGGGIGGGTATRRRAAFNDADRVFSQSSVSASRESPAPSSTQTTPSHAPTPTSSFPSARESNQPTPGSTATGKGTAASKKKKAADKDDDDADAKPAKRGKITYGRE